MVADSRDYSHMMRDEWCIAQLLFQYCIVCLELSPDQIRDCCVLFLYNAIDSDDTSSTTSQSILSLLYLSTYLEAIH